MTGIKKQQQVDAHNLIDKAIEESLKESPDAVNEIARLTGQTPMIVYRRFIDLGYVYRGGRWVMEDGKDE